MREAAGAFLTSTTFDSVELFLKLRDALELNLEIAAHCVHDLTAFIQQIDDVVELFSGHIVSASLRDAWKAPCFGRHHVRAPPAPRILLLGWLCGNVERPNWRTVRHTERAETVLAQRLLLVTSRVHLITLASRARDASLEHT